MPQATFWFSSPFRDWIGQRTLTLDWEGSLTLRQAFEHLGSEHPVFHEKLIAPGLSSERLNRLAAVILNGDFLSLESVIPDGAAVDVLTPLTGGT